MTADPHVEVVGTFAALPEELLYDSRLSAAAVRVYGALVRHGSDPSNCYPSLGRLADLLGGSRASVKRWIAELEAAGWVERVARYSPQGDPASNGYRVFTTPREIPQGGFTSDTGCTAGEPGGVTSEPRGGVTSEPRVGSPVSHKREPLNESHRNEHARGSTRAPTTRAKRATEPDGFADCWKIYPRKLARKSAARAFKARLRDGTPLEDLTTATRHFAAAMTNRPPDKIMHGSTFYGPDDRWRDYLNGNPETETDVRYQPPDPTLTGDSSRGKSRWG